MNMAQEIANRVLQVKLRKAESQRKEYASCYWTFQHNKTLRKHKDIIKLLHDMRDRKIKYIDRLKKQIAICNSPTS